MTRSCCAWRSASQPQRPEPVGLRRGSNREHAKPTAASAHSGSRCCPASHPGRACGRSWWAAGDITENRRFSRACRPNPGDTFSASRRPAGGSHGSSRRRNGVGGAPPGYEVFSSGGATTSCAAGGDGPPSRRTPYSTRARRPIGPQATDSGPTSSSVGAPHTAHRAGRHLHGGGTGGRAHTRVVTRPLLQRARCLTQCEPATSFHWSALRPTV